MTLDLAALVARFAAQLVPGWTVTFERRAPADMPIRNALATCLPTPTRSMAHLCIVDPWPASEDVAETVAHEMTHACLSPLTALLEKTPAAVMLEEQAVENIGKALAAASPGVSAAMARAVAKFAPRLAARLTAPRGRTGGSMDEETLTAALDALIAGDTTKAAEILKTLIAKQAAGGAGGHKEPDGDEAKPAGQAAPPVDGAAPAKDEEKKPEPAPAARSGASSEELTLARRVQELEAREVARVEADERAKLFAERPDFSPEVKDVLGRASIETLRDAVKTFPRVGAVRAQTKTPEPARAPTRGAGQGDDDGSSPERAALDEQMGVRARTVAVRYEGTRQVFPAMTPEQARAARAGKEQTR